MEDLVPLNMLVPRSQRNILQAMADQEQLKRSDIGRRAITFFLQHCQLKFTESILIDENQSTNQPDQAA